MLCGRGGWRPVGVKRGEQQQQGQDQPAPQGGEGPSLGKPSFTALRPESTEVLLHSLCSGSVLCCQVAHALRSASQLYELWGGVSRCACVLATANSHSYQLATQDSVPSRSRDCMLPCGLAVGCFRAPASCVTFTDHATGRGKCISSP